MTLTHSVEVTPSGVIVYMDAVSAYPRTERIGRRSPSATHVRPGARARRKRQARAAARLVKVAR